MHNDQVIDQIQRYMGRHGLNETHLAARLDIAQSQLSRWLHKRVRVGRAWVELLRVKGIISENPLAHPLSDPASPSLPQDQ